MGTSTSDLFGAGAAGEPATPGSYGEAPSGFRLPEATRLGPVHLQVADLTRSLGFHEEVLGFRVVERSDARAVLAAHGDDTAMVVLHEHPGARRMVSRGRLGLFHFAILLPDRASLGRFVRHLGERGVYAGAGDHLVSEALYLQDPDGLGVEVYADRPRQTWRRLRRELMLATDPVDMDGLVKAAGDAPWRGMPAGTVIGHVHLHVGDIALASSFYSGALGFDRMSWRYPGALFLGAGGYHHHVATNTWAGSDATPPAASDAQLLEWTIELPDRVSLDAAARSLASGGYPVERPGDDGMRGERGAVVTRDPWGTSVRLMG